MTTMFFQHTSDYNMHSQLKILKFRISLLRDLGDLETLQRFWNYSFLKFYQKMPNFLKFGIFDIQRSLDFVTAGFSMRPAHVQAGTQAKRDWSRREHNKFFRKLRW